MTEHFPGDGIISRYKGYGTAGRRVDGNLFAAMAAVHAAKMYVNDNSFPVMIEATTFRQGHHTSDDLTRYRNDVKARTHHDVGDRFVRMSSFLEDYEILR